LRPEGYAAPKAEAGNANVDGGLEYLLMVKESALTFPSSQAFLEDPNVWIADTAATVHTTPHKQGTVNRRAATREDAITVSNVEAAKQRWKSLTFQALCAISTETN
jgi:hypothetical protein